MATRKETLAEAQRLLSCSRSTAPSIAKADAALSALSATRKTAPLRAVIADLAAVDDREVQAAVFLLRELCPVQMVLPAAPEVVRAVVAVPLALPGRVPLALLPAHEEAA